ncbi:MAG TPA: TetR/AcrR family transcriptional regulator [Solirubrobacterales bacterium]
MSPVTDTKPKRRRMSAADRRETILDAALEEFSVNGFHGTSLEGVADRAGISKALIYEHFPSKRDLHEALLGRYVHELLERVIGAIATAAPPEERLRSGADAFLSFVEDYREPWRLIVRNPEDSGIDTTVGRVQSEIAHAVAALMQADATPEMEEEPDHGRFVIEMMAQQLVGAWRGVAIWWDDHRDVPRERLLTTLMDFAWVGLDRLSQGESWAG